MTNYFSQFPFDASINIISLQIVNNKQIMYDCDKGYVLEIGPPGATCVGGKWRPLELPQCLLGQHPRLRWNRKRRSIQMRYLRSQYLLRNKRDLQRKLDEIINANFQPPIIAFKHESGEKPYLRLFFFYNKCKLNSKDTYIHQFITKLDVVLSREPSFCSLFTGKVVILSHVLSL